MNASTSSNSTSARPLAAIILAAGKGKRMNSDLPKVVHPVADQPMVKWVVKAAREAGASPIVLVVGHGAEHVRSIFASDRDIIFVMQEQQLGTGHAVDQARDVFANKPEFANADVFVLAGDGPLIRIETLRTMLAAHRKSNAAATLATSVIDDATGYGRIVREAAIGGGGAFQAIVEHKDATEAQRAIREVNPSYYCFHVSSLFNTLGKLDNKNANGEYYITDVFGLLRQASERVEVIEAVPPEDVLSINDPQQLAEVDAILRARFARSPLPVGEGLGVRAVDSITGDSCAPSPRPSPKGRGSAPVEVQR